MDPAAQVLFNYLRDVMYNPKHARMDSELLPEGFRELGAGLQYFAECLMESTELVNSLSRGELEVPLPSRGNEMAVPLKALHAALRHLVWQARQVAQGDYSQRIAYMGEFSLAFNNMAERLEQQHCELLAEIERSRRKTKDLECSNSLLASITGEISQWIIVMDSETAGWLFVNHEADEILRDIGYEPELRSWMERQAVTMTQVQGTLCAELALPREMAEQYFTVEIHPLSWHGSRAFAFVLTDVSEEKQKLYRLENAAYYDKLTQLYNRHYGMKVLNEWVENKRLHILCFADMDNLKYVNDRFGHAEGDKYILAVTAVLRQFSETAIVCRLGGDEFMLLAEGWREEDAERQMETLRELLHSVYITEASYRRSLSYGIVQVNTDNSRSAADLLSIADEKMYRYKRTYKAWCRAHPE